MDEETLNMEVRKFLKHFGVTAQREIETAVRDAVKEGRLAPDATIHARARLTIEPLEGEVVIDREIRLG